MENGSEPPVPPFVTVIMDPAKGEVLVTNIRQEARPAMLWLVEWARLQILSNKVAASPLVAPPHGMAGLLKRMG